MPKPTAARTADAASADPAAAAMARFDLTPGATYRLAYSVGGARARRVSRSIGGFHGTSRRRLWSGETASCLDFILPHGRPLSLVAAQLVDARLALRNRRGQWVLASAETSAPGSEQRPG